MTKSALFVTAALALTVASMFLATPAHAAENTHLRFVSEYIRELAENETSRERAEKEMVNPDDRLPAIVRNGTRIMLQLRSQISMMKRMTLQGQLANLPGMITKLYQQKIEVQAEAVQAAKALLTGPKPGVDYSALVARAPELTAAMNHLDHTLFEATPLVFASLIDQQPDRQGHLSRLTITLAERGNLVRSLQISFGQKMEQKGDQGYLVGSATVLRDYLTKQGYKCSDEPM
jgi:hypothetical protein